jgi:hypothetical protein
MVSIPVSKTQTKPKPGLIFGIGSTTEIGPRTKFHVPLSVEPELHIVKDVMVVFHEAFHPSIHPSRHPSMDGIIPGQK